MSSKVKEDSTCPRKIRVGQRKIALTPNSLTHPHLARTLIFTHTYTHTHTHTTPSLALLLIRFLTHTSCFAVTEHLKWMHGMCVWECGGERGAWCVSVCSVWCACVVGCLHVCACACMCFLCTRFHTHWQLSDTLSRGLSAFSSGYFPPLATLGLQIQVGIYIYICLYIYIYIYK